ncbi:MAG: AsnC family transcriptional regulator [Candidatus Micrarchaeota archaeon]|nr:AsnC family transcriptional regulator [Candidatus Micrarchaeota archaeon]
MKSNEGENTAMPAALDHLDRQLLYWLDRDSRMSVPLLARKVRASPSRVRYRIRALLEKGHILSFITIIDYRLLGWRVYTLHCKLRELPAAAMDALMKRILRNPRVVDLFLTEGAFDVQVAFLALDLDEAADTISELREELGPHIVDEKMTVHLRSQLYPRKSLLPGDGGEPAKPLRVLDIHPAPARLDEADTRILEVLATHADWPVWKVAKAAGLTGPTTYARIARLEKQKVILGYSVLFNPSLPGFARYRVLVKLHYIPPQRREEMVRYLQQLPQVFRSTFTFGDYDLYYDLIAAGGADRRAVMQALYTKFGSEVIRQDWVRVHGILKFSYFLTSDEKKG